MNNNQISYKWFGWLSWGCFIICLIVFGRNFINKGKIDLSMLEWGIIVLLAIGEIIFSKLKNKLKHKVRI